jgi:RNA polymerase sigma-70 factor, ECF subfamily
MRNKRRIAVHQNEKALVERAKAGDTDAFGVLYTHYLTAIYRFIFFRVDDEPVAEDLTEEVFIKAWEALPRYTVGEHPFVTWLYRIASNSIVDHHRKNKKYTPISEIELRLLRMPDMSPEEHAEVQRNASLLYEALSKLTEEEKQVVVLRFAEGLTHLEVGAIMGKTEGACRVIQHRALSNLYALLRQNKEQVNL